MSGLPTSLGLLADYDSSDEEALGGLDSGAEASTGAAERRSIGGTVNYFEGDDISSEEDSGNVPADTVQPVEIVPSVRCPVDYISETRLPAPKLGAAVESGLQPGQSGVFANPFREQQKVQLSLLEKHVQLTVREQPAEIGGRKICLAYRKDGRCRFGRSCKFAHDSDLQVASNAGIPGGHAEDAAMLIPAQEWASGQEGSGDVQPVRGKRKPGLSQTLIPPKRSVKNYKAQLAKERPWVL